MEKCELSKIEEAAAATKANEMKTEKKKIPQENVNTYFSRYIYFFFSYVYTIHRIEHKSCIKYKLVNLLKIYIQQIASSPSLKLLSVYKSKKVIFFYF